MSSPCPPPFWQRRNVTVGTRDLHPPPVPCRSYQVADGSQNVNVHRPTGGSRVFLIFLSECYPSTFRLHFDVGTDLAVGEILNPELISEV